MRRYRWVHTTTWPDTNVTCYWQKVITWYKIELAGRILGNEACSILKRGSKLQQQQRK